MLRDIVLKALLVGCVVALAVVGTKLLRDGTLDGIFAVLWGGAFGGFPL